MKGVSTEIPLTSFRTDSSGKPFIVFSIHVRINSNEDVTLASSEWIVLRRFSHFVLLHDLLQKRFGSTNLANGNNNSSSSNSNEPAIQLPLLPEKESAALYSSPDSIEARRVKLEIYLSTLISIDVLWTSSEFVSFLDNESRTLLTEMNYRQMVHAQRILASVGAKNVKRTQSVQKKMIETDTEMQRLNRKVDQLEAMINARLELKSQASTSNTSSIHRDDQLDDTPSRSLPLKSITEQEEREEERDTSINVLIPSSNKAAAAIPDEVMLSKTSPLPSPQAKTTTNDNVADVAATTISPSIAPPPSSKSSSKSSSLSSSSSSATTTTTPSSDVKSLMISTKSDLPQPSTLDVRSGGATTPMGDIALRYVETYKKDDKRAKNTSKKKNQRTNLSDPHSVPHSLPSPTSLHTPSPPPLIPHTLTPVYLDDQCKLFRNRTTLLANDVTTPVLSKLLDWACGPVTDPSMPSSSSSSISLGMNHQFNNGPFEDTSEVVTLSEIIEHSRGGFRHFQMNNQQVRRVPMNTASSMTTGGGGGFSIDNTVSKRDKIAPPSTSPSSSSSSSSSQTQIAYAPSSSSSAASAPMTAGSSYIGGTPLSGSNLFSVLSFINQMRDQQQKDQTQALRHQQQQQQQQPSNILDPSLAHATSTTIITSTITPPLPDMFLNDPALSAIAATIDEVIECISPTEESELARGRIFSYISNVIRESVCGEAVPVGSNASKLYLPGSDIDISIFIGSRGRQTTASSSSSNTNPQPSSHHNHMPHSSTSSTSSSSSSSSSSSHTGSPSGSEWFERLNEALCLASMGASAKQSATSSSLSSSFSSSSSLLSSGGGRHVNDSKPSSSSPQCKVSNVTFINADVRVVRSIVDDIEVDITSNSYTSLSAAALIEACDRLIGFNHLLKRSILLIKCWSQIESGSFTSSGDSFLNSSAGGLSSMSLCIMVIALFNSHERRILHPLQALILFFEEYARMPWGARLITIFGPRQLYLEQGAPQPKELSRPSSPRFLTPQMLRPFRLYAASCLPNEVAKGGHAQREPSMLNVLDPNAAWINMGKSVRVKGITPLNEALLLGRDRCRYLLNMAAKAAAAATSSQIGSGTSTTNVSVGDLKRNVSYMFLKTLTRFGGGRIKGNAGDISSSSPSSSQQQSIPSHPMDASKTSSTTTTSFSSKGADPLKGDSTLMSLAMEVSGTLIGGRVSTGALSAIILQQLLARLSSSSSSSGAVLPQSSTSNSKKKSSLSYKSAAATLNASAPIPSSSPSPSPPPLLLVPHGSILIADLEKILTLLSGSPRLVDIIIENCGSLAQFIFNQPDLFELIDLNENNNYHSVETSGGAYSQQKTTSKKEWCVTLAPGVSEAFNAFAAEKEENGC